ncbi:MFS transporter [Limosilactobacillus reuteri]|uniref:DHA2 family efflux MFS transporter permease subunit n=2 Tax=Limosilactobacillus reuteri TaxID=1598 RepID=A0A7X2G1U3_LIMRT|nr:MFS transporter [Limosilactobacillus reuteri]MRG90112.1 DHA2 family efflux MFS transporter permease subunit [Limosilactobacillus reuteri]
MTKRKNKFLIIIAMCISIFLCMLDTTVMNIALPAIQNELHVTLTNLSWALNIYTILFASLTIPLSKLAEKLGMSFLYIIGLIMFLIGSSISGISPNLAILILGRGIQSLGAALLFPLSMTIGINIVTIKTRKKVIAALGITQGLAAALGPSIGGILTQFMGWHSIFSVNIPFTILSLIICLSTLNFHEPKSNEGNDYLGSFLGIILLSSLTLILTQGRSWGWKSPAINLLFFIFILTFILFLVTEHYAKAPMIPLILFKNREFTGSAISIILSNLFLVAVTVILPTYFTHIQHRTELEAALLITPITGMIFIMSPLSAILLDKLGSRAIILSGFLLMSISYYLFTHIDMDNITLVIFTCIILGTGYGIIAGPITVLAASNFEGYLLTASQSVAGVLRQVGVSLAVAIFLTGLYGNLSTAKHNSINYINQQVNSLNVPKHQKNKIRDNSIKSLNNNLNSQTPSKHFSRKLIKETIDKEYAKQITSLPSEPSKIQEREIYLRTETNVKLVFHKLNNSINTTIKKIKDYANRQYSNAFINLYRVSLPFLIFSCLSCLLFPKRKR